MVSSLKAGPINVTVTDANNCFSISSIVITEPEKLIAYITGSDVRCYNGSDGVINLAVSQTAKGLNYLWNNGVQTKDQINNARRLSKHMNVSFGDCIHAIVAKDNDAVLVSRDKDFKRLRYIIDVKSPEELI